MNCEMCGRNIDSPYEVEVEGTMMELCKDCSKFGKIIEKPKVIVKKPKRTIVKQEEFIEVVIEDYSDKIKHARELRGLKQKDLAIKTGIKESLLHKIESGHIEPSLDIAKKLEKFLGIKLIEKRKEEHKMLETKKMGLTIGDVLKVKE